ncbi:MAG: endonuclease domain-containing protein [Candidatus Margulisbacteria bacterium]|nr:endonuclease domain-containing protein [Candidatus Margulisiibacteriota bacterium]
MTMKYKDNLFKGANKKIFDNAKDLRKFSTECEEMLWQELRDKKLLGYIFRRQHPISEFIADFYCHKLNLVIEIDGSVHNVQEQKEYDQARTKEMNRLGINIIRIKNNEIKDNLPNVIEKIKLFTQSLPSLKGEGSRRGEA